MEPRDLAIIIAVVILGAVAALDALRGDASEPGGDTQASDTGTPTETGPPARESFPPVPARGSLAFTTEDCRLRDVSVSAGTEFPLPLVETNCELWAAPLTNRLAYGVASPSQADRRPIRFLDPGRSGVDLGTFEALGDVVWSQDGQLAAWCDSATNGFEYEVGQFDSDTGDYAVRELDFCPRGYTPEGKLAYTNERELIVEGVPRVDVGALIYQLAWGTDGSVGLVLDVRPTPTRSGFQLVRRLGSRVTSRARLPAELVGMPVTFSPDNCAALIVGIPTVRIVDVGCFRGASQAYEGHAAAWSPDGEWVAIARPDQIVFQRLIGGDDLVTWAASANSLAWRQ